MFINERNTNIYILHYITLYFNCNEFYYYYQNETIVVSQVAPMLNCGEITQSTPKNNMHFGVRYLRLDTTLQCNKVGSSKYCTIVIKITVLHLKKERWSPVKPSWVLRPRNKNGISFGTSYWVGESQTHVHFWVIGQDYRIYVQTWELT